ncbi:MAG: rsmE [Phycisphaerales bacterium]|nr:rsmE [Phycisphaerales bacterium]
MARRLLVPVLRAGLVTLPGNQAHHARDVLRLGVGDEVELFTAAGLTAAAVIVEATPANVVAEVREIREAAGGLALTIASAVPKAARGDWMIEKLSELGVARFVPLMTARSVVHPEGKNKIERWERLAAESAKQSRRAGVMRIDALTPLGDVLARLSGKAAYLSTAADAVPLSSILHSSSSSLTLLVGPEGGWSDGELGQFAERHLTGITLGGTILRVETAAIAAAAVVAALVPRVPAEAPHRSPDHP